MLSLRERVALERAPKRKSDPGRLFGSVGDVVGKVWNSPNTALGVLAGGVGYGLAQANRLRPGPQPVPGVAFGHNAVEFTNNPLGGVSAVTLGNAILYSDDKYASEAGRAHEQAHTYQGQQLGPAYLPSNLLGGLWAMAKDGRWHGDHNWNERGPQLTPPRPWTPVPRSK